MRGDGSFWGSRILAEERWDWDKFVVENGGGIGIIGQKKDEGLVGANGIV